MCYHTRKKADATMLRSRFGAMPADDDLIVPGADYNGFEHPLTPVITAADPAHIQLYQWGLVPSWAKDDALKKSTLNARIETIREKPAFKGSLQQRCLVLLDGFYEWQWLDPQGKQKQKYLISLPDDEPFAIAGLWSAWSDGVREVHSYTIITTEARGIMREIHNSKLRMPVILSKENERPWLMGQTKGDIHPGLVARKV